MVAGRRLRRIAPIPTPTYQGSYDTCSFAIFRNIYSLRLGNAKTLMRIGVFQSQGTAVRNDTIFEPEIWAKEKHCRRPLGRLPCNLSVFFESLESMEHSLRTSADVCNLSLNISIVSHTYVTVLYRDSPRSGLSTIVNQIAMTLLHPRDVTAGYAPS